MNRRILFFLLKMLFFEPPLRVLEGGLLVILAILKLLSFILISLKDKIKFLLQDERYEEDYNLWEMFLIEYVYRCQEVFGEYFDHWKWWAIRWNEKIFLPNRKKKKIVKALNRKIK